MDGDRNHSSSDSQNTRIDAVEESFSVLGDETRLEILFALTEEANKNRVGAGLSFSELRTRVSVEDSGRFNYHLNKLSETFVTQIDDKYVARLPGLAVIAAVYAGAYHDTGTVETKSAETEFTCVCCGKGVTANYGENPLYPGVWVECEEHGIADRYPVPPGAKSERSVEELMRVGYSRLCTNLDLARQGICLQCWGTVSIEYPTDPPTEQFKDSHIPTKVSCNRCWNQFPALPLRMLFVKHPLVASPFRARGHTLLETLQQLARTGDDAPCETTVHDGDPPRASIEITLDDETLVLDVDDSCTVVDHQWC
ncbi:winged helix-turn-helix domain-containing protein [Halovenus rubra]|uniref:Winged helix-turn-helix domain-containing protein n=2 Tax=Halovenus rubra TaxID=869890 RepID=A0ABD5XE52_9EURY|nr:helix-turn-helix domain-containing protein [Halovenus rubra]